MRMSFESCFFLYISSYVDILYYKKLEWNEGHEPNLCGKNDSKEQVFLDRKSSKKVSNEYSEDTFRKRPAVLLRVVGGGLVI